MKSFTLVAGLVLSSFVLTQPLSVIAQDAPEAGTLTLKTTVRRVVVDVVVTDADGKAAPGLTKEDFALFEDGKLQKVMSFDPSGFEPAMDYMPPKLPAEPTNTFVNLPATPEKGPLYVLLSDLVNMDNPDQMSMTVNQHSDQIFGRKELAKFIQGKPEGARFAIFVWSDGLHLIQGFTSDKAQLYAAIDPKTSRPHIPEIFLMGENFGCGDIHATVGILNALAGYLDGMPGRKNLIWFSGGFPLSFAPTKNDGPNYVGLVKATLNHLAQNQISIYPVDVRGVIAQDWHTTNGMEGGGELVSDRNKGEASSPAVAGVQSDAAASASTGAGVSLAAGSYMGMDQIAAITGGRAFYSNNKVTESLAAATENGASYYSLTYSPSNKDYNGRLRNIHVEMARKGYHVSYRRAYYGTDQDSAPAQETAQGLPAAATPDLQRSLDDTLEVNMKHGAPIAHQLIFGAHVYPAGPPAKGTPEQMAQLATQVNGGKSRLRSTSARPPSPVPLQPYLIDYTVMTHQLQQLPSSHAALNLEVAAAAYDADGRMLNATVSNAREGDAGHPANAQPAKAFRVRQQMDVPVGAAFIRIAVRDVNTDRIGAMEVRLPLAPENQSANAADPAKKMGADKTN